jgi:predicted metal-dependent hydrolase
MKRSEFDFRIVRMKRKSIALHLLRDGSLEVRAPHRVSEKALVEFVETKKDWIRKAKDRRTNIILLPVCSAGELLIMKKNTMEKVDVFLQDFNGRKPVKIAIRKQKTVWGTCNRQGTLSINAFCCLLPDPLFEYILIHELCHLVELNHSPRFWSCVSSYLPDWKTKRASLRKFRIV